MFKSFLKKTNFCVSEVHRCVLFGYIIAWKKNDNNFYFLFFFHFVLTFKIRGSPSGEKIIRF